MRLRSILTIVFACIAMLLPVSRALAQAEIPKDTIERGVLNAADKELIDKFISPRLSKLSSPDSGAIKTSRDEILRSFRDPLISVAFRQYFSDKIKDELKKNAGAPDVVGVNALIICGEIATGDTASILESKLNDPSEPVRYAATKGVERTMEAVSKRSPAIPAGRVEGLLTKLGEVIKDPTSSEKVVDIAFRAIRKSMDIDRQGYDVRLPAMRIMAESVDKVCERPEASPKDLFRPAELVSQLFTNPDPARPLSPETIAQAATLSGHLLSWASCQIKKGKLPLGNPEARVEATVIVRAAERIIHLAGERVNKPNSAPALAEDFGRATAEGDRAFFKNLLTLLDPLSSAPFNIKVEKILGCGGPN